MIHSGHQTIRRCLLWITTAMWRPNDDKHEMNILSRIAHLHQGYSMPQQQPLPTSELPNRPCEKVANHLFHFNGKTYILKTDCYKPIEVQSMSTSEQTVQALETIFSRPAIPSTSRNMLPDVHRDGTNEFNNFNTLIIIVKCERYVLNVMYVWCTLCKFSLLTA